MSCHTKPVACLTTGTGSLLGGGGVGPVDGSVLGSADGGGGVGPWDGSALGGVDGTGVITADGDAEGSAEADGSDDAAGAGSLSALAGMAPTATVNATAGTARVRPATRRRRDPPLVLLTMELLKIRVRGAWAH
jgi:hypothetical protein